MASLRKRGRVWYYRYTDADGIRRERKGFTDRRETSGSRPKLRRGPRR